MSGEMNIQMYGADMPCLLQSPREYELSKYMHPPKVVDTSDFVLSPMPGTLISFSVKEGDHVELGQELCIVEAMKMQNVLAATRDATVKTLLAEKGATLAADQPIILFEQD